MRLELNLPALQALLSVDSEIEVHLRQAVCEEFARKHLKTLLNDTTWKKVSAEWRADMDQVVSAKLAELIGERRERSENMTASDVWGLKEGVDKVVEAALTKALDELVLQRAAFLAKEIERQVKQYVDLNIKQLVAARVKEIMANATATAMALSSK